MSSPSATARSTEATTALFECSREGFVFATVFERVPDATVAFEPAVSSPSNHVLVTVGDDSSRRAIEDALGASPDVATVVAAERDERCWQYRVSVADETKRLIERVTTGSIALLEAATAGEHWRLRVLATERGDLARVQATLEAFGAEPCCRRIRRGIERTNATGLTDSQRETLTTAFEHGYYDVPRAVTAADLADHLGVSHQALSERLRRAHANLVAETIASE